MKSKTGFTLAEVLITLGIIGVVSAMTVPSLMNKYQRQTYVTQLHQTYNLLQQAFLQQIQETNAVDLKESRLNTVAGIQTFITSKFKTVTSCTDSSKAMMPCFADSYQNMNGTALTKTNFWASVPCYSLANGSAICMEFISYHTYADGGVNKPYGHITIDINGAKGPNMAGRDLFFVTYYSDGSIDEDNVTPECKKSSSSCTGGGSPEAIRNLAYTTCATRADAKGCFGKIINDGWQMTY